MELMQELADTEKEARENGQKIEHWQKEHDNLQLEEIEYVAFVFFFFHCLDVFLLVMMTMMQMMKMRMANQTDSPTNLPKAKSRRNPMQHYRQRQSRRNRQGSYIYIAWKSWPS